MKRAAILLLLCAVAAAAQPASPPVENVTVTGTKSREMIHAFVQSFAAPTHVLDRIARWEDGVCPVAIGLKPAFVRYITARLRDVAKQVGAPVNHGESCAPNIEIVFTTAPQALMDDVKKRQPALLGYYDNQAQRDALATVTRPVQAWYTTATRDLRGNTQVDGGQIAGTGLDIPYACPPAGMCMLHLSNAHAASVTGSRLGDGQRSSLYNVIIVADPTKLTDYEVGTLADYVAMLALTQPKSQDACQSLPSILNLLVKDGGNSSKKLTANDLGFLHGLYKMSPDRNLGGQQDEIAYQMQQSLEGK